MAGSPCQTKVRNLDTTVISEQNVFGLEIAVDNPRGVGGVQTIQNGFHNVESLRWGQSPEVVEQFPQSDSRQVLHHNERDGTVLPLVENIHNIGVGKPCCLTRLLDKATREFGILSQVGVHDLDGNGTLKPLIHRFIDGCHATPGNPTFDDVTVVDYPAKQRVNRGGVHLADCRAVVPENLVATPLGQFV